MTDALEWYVCYTTASGERLAKEDLEALGFQVILPLRLEWRRVPAHRRRARPDGTRPPKRQRVERLLFPRYLFVGVLPHWRDFAGMRRSKRVREILCDAYGVPKRLPERVAASLHLVSRIDAAPDRAAAAAEVAAWIGMRARVVAGPFKGAHGRVVQAGKTGLRIDIEGPNGATFPLNVPLEQLGFLSIFSGQDDQQ